MSEIEKYHTEETVQELITTIDSSPLQIEQSTNLITPILKRWYLVLITSFIISAIGLPAIWLLIKPFFSVTAAIRVAPIIQNILFSDRDSESVLPMYKSFMNTQAELIISDQVLQRAADDLAGKNLDFFNKPYGTLNKLQDKLAGKQTTNPVDALKKAIVDEFLSVKTGKETELVKIIMKDRKLEDMVLMIDSIVRSYMAIVVSEEAKGGDQKLSVLENERKLSEDKQEKYRNSIRQMADEYGSLALTSRQDIMLQKMASMQAELTKIQMRRITLEAQVQLLKNSKEQNRDTEKLSKLRQEFINADQTVQALIQNIKAMDQQVLLAKQTPAPVNPELKQRVKVLETMKERLEEKTKELEQNFDEMMAREIAQSHKLQLGNIEAELSEAADYEKRLQDMVSKENTDTIEIGRKQLAIQDQQEQLKLNAEMYDSVRRRIQELEMERKRPARISVAYNATVAPLKDKRLKFSAVIILGSLACGMFLAFMISKADHSLSTPNDLVKRIGVRIIGTTTNPYNIKRPKLAEQISSDYQTILANLRLMIGTTINPDNIKRPKLSEQISSDYQTILANLRLMIGTIPKKIVITSAGIQEGKTTFAINLATSMARAGKKVLLIDGDLRKPDIANVLNLPKSSRGLQDIILGKNFESVVCSIPETGFDVLTADSVNISDALQLITQRHVSSILHTISIKYDHVIIDTPPIMAFTDALVWAKMSDGVIMISFAGRTQENDLKNAFERLEQIKVKVLGTILNNVDSSDSYERYRYAYSQTEGKDLKKKRTMLMLPEKKEGKSS